MKTKLINDSAVQRLIKEVGPDRFMDLAIKYVEQGFSDYNSGKIEKLRRNGFLFGTDTIESMPARRVGKHVCFKIVNFHQKNVIKQIKDVMSTSLILDEATGFPLVISDTTLLTSIRTGATSGIAVKYMRPGAKSIGIIGTGNVGQTTAHAICRLIGIERIYIYDIDKKIMKVFKDVIGRLTGKEIIISSPQEISEKCDVVATCTYGQQIVVRDEWIKAPKLILSIGSDTPGKIEVEPKIIPRSRIVVDFKAQAVIEGEISNAIKQAIFAPDKIFAELHEIIKGTKKVLPADLCLFDSTGDPIEDLVMTELILKLGKFEEEDFTYSGQNFKDTYSRLL